LFMTHAWQHAAKLVPPKNRGFTPAATAVETEHYPPMRRGMNSLSSAVGANIRIGSVEHIRCVSRRHVGFLDLNIAQIAHSRL
jgi:hypothetical protein